jgi:ABC-2 type transport system ATP-binding protein
VSAAVTAAAGAPVVQAERCSKWYGHVLGISDITWQLPAGIVGLLGPNGAGKSTLIKLMAGLIQPSRGKLEVFGASPFHDTEVRRRIGHAPEHEKTYDELTAIDLVSSLARLSGVPARSAREAAADALDQMGMKSAMHRTVQIGRAHV